MKSDGPIHTDDDWMARRMKEVVERISGCRAEIRPASEGSPHPVCDLWLFYEDDAARERMYDAIEWLIPEFKEGLANADAIRAITGRAKGQGHEHANRGNLA